MRMRSDAPPVALGVAPENRAHTLPADPADPELVEVVKAWPTLPAMIRRGLLALVRTARPGGA